LEALAAKKARDAEEKRRKEEEERRREVEMAKRTSPCIDYSLIWKVEMAKLANAEREAAEAKRIQDERVAAIEEKKRKREEELSKLAEEELQAKEAEERRRVAWETARKEEEEAKESAIREAAIKKLGCLDACMVRCCCKPVPEELSEQVGLEIQEWSDFSYKDPLHATLERSKKNSSVQELHSIFEAYSIQGLMDRKGWEDFLKDANLDDLIEKTALTITRQSFDLDVDTAEEAEMKQKARREEKKKIEAKEKAWEAQDAVMAESKEKIQAMPEGPAKVVALQQLEKLEFRHDEKSPRVKPPPVPRSFIEFCATLGKYASFFYGPAAMEASLAVQSDREKPNPNPNPNPNWRSHLRFRVTGRNLTLTLTLTLTLIGGLTCGSE